MNNGLLSGIKALPDIPAWMGGGNPAFDGLALVADSTQEGGAKLSAAANAIVVALVDAATILIDASLGSLFWVVLGGNRTIAAPTNPVGGQRITIRLAQDSTGSRTVTWNSIFRFGVDVPAPTLSTTANLTDYLGFIYNSTASKWDCQATARGY